MDVLEIIKSKLRPLQGTPSERGLNAVIQHIDIAESHFNSANSGEDYLYTDVIYRTNQAFEGAIKEAYRVLENADPNNKRPYDIEIIFENGDILKPRVLSQFKTYRKEWRNKSTHDYALFFSSQEALLAIMSVTAFLGILLDQILEKHAYDVEKEKLKGKDTKCLDVVSEHCLFDECIEILNRFTEELRIEIDVDNVYTEYELLGKMAAFISSQNSELEVLTKYSIKSDRSPGNPVVDILIKNKNETLIVEVKTPTQQYYRKATRAKEQLMNYLEISSTPNGIVYAPVLRSSTKLEIDRGEYDSGNGTINIAVFTPALVTA